MCISCYDRHIMVSVQNRAKVRCPFCRAQTTLVFIGPNELLTQPIDITALCKPTVYTKDLLHELRTRLLQSDNVLAKQEILCDCVPDLFKLHL